MDSDKIRELLEHPQINTGFHLGYYCPDGWDDLLSQLIADIKEQLCEGLVVNVDQIKEKFARLDIYVSFGTDNNDKNPLQQKKSISEIIRLLELASEKSRHVCEFCGHHGECCNSTTGWMVTACKSCADLNNLER